jgi:hypothetical protein
MSQGNRPLGIEYIADWIAANLAMCTNYWYNVAWSPQLIPFTS